MKEMNAKGTKGFLMRNFETQEFFFRVYGNKTFVDYPILTEELEVEITSDWYSFYEKDKENFLDFSTKARRK